MTTLSNDSDLDFDNRDTAADSSAGTDTDASAETGRAQRPALQTAIVILLATAFVAFWVLSVRAGHGASGVDFSVLGRLDVEPYLLGIAVQELLPPVILLLILSRTAIFQRAVSNELKPTEQLMLVVAMVALYIFFVLFEFWLVSTFQAQITFGNFVIVIAGILGGLYGGLAVGVCAALGMGLINYLTWGDSDPFNLNYYLAWHVFESTESINAMWIGLSAGLLGETVPWRKRFAPTVVLLIGLSVLLVVGIVGALSDPWGDFYVLRFLPGLIVSGAGLLAFSVMATTVQNERARQKAEQDRLALAEANLDLAQTRLALTQAELRALHAQINPHFFFNSLNTIRYFIRTDPDNARSLLTKLSEIFQRSLSAGEFVTLDEEFAHVEAYLALEKARLEERLQVVWTNMAKEHGDHQIPTLIVQPLVENAVIHGISPKPEGGTIHIIVNSMNEQLLIQVDDNGVGFDQHPVPLNRPLRHVDSVNDQTTTNLPTRPVADASHNGSGSSIGLNNIHERLRMLYGDAGSLRIESESGRGTKAILTIPINDAH